MVARLNSIAARLTVAAPISRIKAGTQDSAWIFFVFFFFHWAFLRFSAFLPFALRKRISARVAFPGLYDRTLQLQVLLCLSILLSASQFLHESHSQRSQ